MFLVILSIEVHKCAVSFEGNFGTLYKIDFIYDSINILYITYNHLNYLINYYLSKKKKKNYLINSELKFILY